MTQRQLRAVVVGASTILGKELLEELNASPAAAWHLRLLEEQEDGEAQVSTAGDEAVVIQPLTAEALDGADLVFFAGDQATASKYRSAALERGAVLVDLTAAGEGESGFLLRSPWLQGGKRPDLETVGVIAAHPAALMLALTFERLNRRFGLDRLTATLLEPASQAGRVGVDQLHQQTVSLLSFQPVPKEVYDAQVAFTLQNTLGEEAKTPLASIRQRIRQHLESLLGEKDAGKIRFDVIQAPVFHGYTASAYADLQKPVSSAEMLEALNGGVIVAEADTAPSNTGVTDTGDLLVAVRAETAGTHPGAWLWMAADNLRFAARNAVSAAMELAALRSVDRVQ